MYTRVFALLLVTLALLFVQGCGSDSKGGLLGGDEVQGRPPPGPDSPKLPNAGASSASTGVNDPLNALRALAASKTIRGEFDTDYKPMMTSDPGERQQGTFEQAGENLRFKIVSGTRMTDTWEMMRYGGTIYLYVKADNAWTERPNDSVAGHLIKSYAPSELAKNWASLSARYPVTKGGSDRVEGKNCQLYSLDNTSNRTKSEVCVANGVAIRYRDMAPYNSYTLTITELNANLEIKAPNKIVP